MLFRNAVLQVLNLFVQELDNLVTFSAYEVIVVVAVVGLEASGG